MNFVVGLLPGPAYLLSVKELTGITGDAIRGLFFASEAWLRVQAQQLAACNARHRISERLSGWLLAAANVTGSDGLVATQDLIAETLAVQRASVSSAATELQKKGCIQYERGQISITDREALQRQACQCHERLLKYRDSLCKSPFNGEESRGGVAVALP